MNMDTIVEIKNLNMQFFSSSNFLEKSKKTTKAIDNLDLEINQGEIFGLVGESGCGKSTLSRCILNLIKPTSGEILFKGEDITKFDRKTMKDFRKKAQMIFQNPYSTLDPKMRIYETLLEPLSIHKIKDKNLIYKAIELVGLSEECLNRYPHEFSGGQKQRIAIARALILNPEFLVADEPVSALDVSIQAQIINLLLELKEKLNLTILFISHDLSIVKYVSDRIAIMYLGEIVEFADKSELFKNPKHPYTQILLNSIPTVDGEPKKIDLNLELKEQGKNTVGCKFYPRCPKAMEACKDNHPAKTQISDTHFVKCFLCEN